MTRSDIRELEWRQAQIHAQAGGNSPHRPGLYYLSIDCPACQAAMRAALKES